MTPRWTKKIAGLKYRGGQLREAFEQAISAVSANKLRSGLTVLGVVVGVMTVIAMVAIIQGLNHSMAQQIQNLGSNVIFVTRWEMGGRMGRESSEIRRRKPIVLEDALAISDQCPAVSEVSPENAYFDAAVRFRENEANSPMVVGVFPEYMVVNATDLSEGRFINESDIRFRTDVAVIGTDVAEALFPNVGAIGRTVTVDGRPMTVVGVLAERGSFLGNSRDNYVLLPYWTFKRIYHWEEELLLKVRTRDAKSIPDAIEQVRQVMRRRHGLRYDKPDDFSISTQDDLMNLYRQITGAIYLAMVVISSIGLMVGGVGVMNIMLVSVKERTREIGVRMAVGARRAAIRQQFLIEAVTLTSIGGVIGIVVGLLISLLVAAVTPLPMGFSWVSAILGFCFSAGVGLFFGLYPAGRAAKLDPIEALRYE